MKFKLNTPFPQSLPKECTKATKIFQSFVDTRNKGFDGFIPRSVLQRAKGFAIFSVFKAGFVFSARAGSGIVIARLEDGSWSAPSAIGTAGMGFGGQAGAEVTDFLIILNSHSAVKSFMSAGSFTLGGNMSIAVGPLGRNGEASGALGTSGSLATMYSYSKTRGLFGGVSVEGSVIVERQDANALAYQSDVTARNLLSGVITPPQWSKELITTLENCTGLSGGHQWIYDGSSDPEYVFGGVASPGSEPPRRKKARSVSFPPASWGRNKDSGSFFTPVSDDGSIPQSPIVPTMTGTFENPSHDFPTRFEDFSSESKLDPSNPAPTSLFSRDAGPSVIHAPHMRSKSDYSQPPRSSNPFLQGQHRMEMNSPETSVSTPSSIESFPVLSKTLLANSLQPQGIARAIALFDFTAIEPGDLTFSKGDVIVVTKKSERTDDWWTGTLNGRQGIFPANFVEIA